MDDLSETPAQRWARTAADDAFPHFAGRGWDGYALAENVFAGWRVSVSCCACGHKAEFGARAIAKLGARWLVRTHRQWAQSLRCSQCGSRRIALCQYDDSGVRLAFRRSTNDDAMVIMSRCLEGLLAEAGVDVLEVGHAVPRYSPTGEPPIVSA